MLSILIVNWNTSKLLEACLASIEKFPPHESHEVIVVDNASSDGSAEMVARQFPNVKLICPGRNLGYAAGNNAAFAAANGDWLLTLNPDTEFRDESLQTALDTLRARSPYSILGIKQIGLDGKVQKSVRGFPTILALIGEITGLAKLGGPLDAYRLTNFDYESEGPAPQPMGTFLLFRREALAAVGDPKKPFDENFPIFFNEVDLLYRLDRAGHRCLYSPDANVLHYGGESTKQVRKSMIWESHRSLVRYLRKHHAKGWTAIALPFLQALIVLAAFVRARGYDAGFRP